MIFQFLFAVAFSAVPLTLYVPPMRHFTLFVATIQDLVRETSAYRSRFFPRFHRAFRFLLTGTANS